MNPVGNCGTLVWIGDPSIPEFQDAYQFCVSQVAQLALRRTVDEALGRPAAAVRCILIARSTREAIAEMLLDRLRQVYPEATIGHLLGSLCEGMQMGAGAWSGSDRLPWHRWSQVLPEWLIPCGAQRQQRPPLCRSVAVVSSTFAAAEPLLDLAQSADTTAVWCRSADSMRVRNVDAVWWDDSVAGPTSAARWRRRTAAFGSSERRPKQAWIVNSPRDDDYREAIKGGIDVVVSKPYHIECLMAMVTSRDAGQSPQSLVKRQAA